MGFEETWTPATEAGRDGVRAILAAPGDAVIALDFDGTLAPIVADPSAARAHPGVLDALRGLASAVGAVAVVTGRPAGLAVEYGGLAGVPGVVVLGHYGAERWEGGELSAPQVHPGVARARAALPDVLAAAGAPEGTWVEDKGRSLAVHTRRTAAPERALELLRAPVGELAAAHGLVVEPGRLVLELRPPGVDKGAALTGFLRERGARSVLYAGDDLGDLAAFAAVEELRAQGLAGVLVCAGAVGDAPVRELADRADVVVDGPEGVVELLSALGEAVRAR
ncbi:trehalose phosphatase [Streptomyces rubellomurinus subsp. indigoferus]|uniref:Trehalose 6-phosphate phosphatase n=1 Tax=Streptomyces rubellomurinus (strain ATCC 31215) TaxID=359131 RepID=A0A0F2TMA5_STRR3|nr:trehalose-phosphatase [Streptomyces rubellomurinus]KJS56841.1 trehalose phosphatase [Streptomyces rubellomurinus subsp. indigoferus]KJS63420.1 trehalose phosphatase [Streptomyces rubellomurinus]